MAPSCDTKFTFAVFHDSDIVSLFMICTYFKKNITLIININIIVSISTLINICNNNIISNIIYTLIIYIAYIYICQLFKEIFT